MEGRRQSSSGRERCCEKMKTQWKERLQEGDEVSVTSRGSQGGERSNTLPRESFVEVRARARKDGFTGGALSSVRGDGRMGGGQVQGFFRLKGRLPGLSFLLL